MARPSDTPKTEIDQYLEFRRILLSESESKISELTNFLHNQTEFSKHISEHLGSAFEQAIQNKDQTLINTLSPVIEKVLQSSIKGNPAGVADIFYPIIGKAIRKSLSNTIKTLNENINQNLEYALSPKGLSWRWQAFKAKKPFSEIVLLNTVQYQVEEVFLLHKSSSLLLHHVSSLEQNDRKNELISSMILALKDFVNRSFNNQGKELQSIEFEDLTLFIETGPFAILALAVRGEPPKAIFNIFREAIENVHHEYHDKLKNFEGDTESFLTTTNILNTCLLSQKKESGKKPKKSPPWMIIGISLCVLSLFLYVGYQKKLNKNLISSIHHKVEQEPGIQITHLEISGTTLHASGIQDPLAKSFDEIVSTLANNKKIKSSFIPIISLDSNIVLKRTIKKLSPPENVELKLNGNTLFLYGSAPIDWIRLTKKNAPLITGIHSVDTQNISPKEALDLEKLNNDFINLAVLFRNTSTIADVSSKKTLESIIVKLHQSLVLAESLNKKISVQFYGGTDGDLDKPSDKVYAEKRSQWLHHQIKERFTTSEALLDPRLYVSQGIRSAYIQIKTLPGLE